MSLKQRLQQLGFSVVTARAAGEHDGDPMLKDIESYPSVFTAHGIKFTRERSEDHFAEYHGTWRDKLIFILLNEHPSSSIQVHVSIAQDDPGDEDESAESFALKGNVYFSAALKRIASAIEERIDTYEQDGR